MQFCAASSRALFLLLVTGTARAVQPWLPATRQSHRGRLLYLRIRENGALDVFGLWLRSEAAERGEILWASDWDTLPLHLCGKQALPSCGPLTWGASNMNETALMFGEQFRVADLGSVVGQLLDDFEVDVFFHAATLGLFGPMYANEVLKNGPAATLEFGSMLGENRLFSSVLTLLMTLRKTMLVMTYEGNLREHLEFPRTLEKGILQQRAQAKPPLMYCWTKDDYPAMACNELSGYPEECILRSQQYWGGSRTEIHATPDSARSAEFSAQFLPVLISECHAHDRSPRPSFVLYYDNDPKRDPNLTQASLVHRATGLPVRVLAKRHDCVEGADEASPGVQCLEKVRGVAAFHQVLHEARLVVAPLSATDNPTLLEAAACGTPVLLQRGQHLMLERYAEAPHVAVWSEWDDLERGLRAAMSATEGGRQKLEPWWPLPLRFDTMLGGMRAVLKASEAKCSGASRAPSS